MGLNRAVVVLLALALAGCANDGGFGPHRETGVLDTTFSGAPTTTASTGRPTTGAPAGVLGSPIGADLDERDRQRAYAAERQALEHGEPGEPTGWRSEKPGRYGTIVPGAPYERGGTRCRDYSHSIYIDGKPQIARMTACRNPDGSWTPVG
jgi:surface antigen